MRTCFEIDRKEEIGSVTSILRKILYLNLQKSRVQIGKTVIVISEEDDINLVASQIESTIKEQLHKRDFYRGCVVNIYVDEKFVRKNRADTKKIKNLKKRKVNKNFGDRNEDSENRN